MNVHRHKIIIDVNTLLDNITKNTSGVYSKYPQLVVILGAPISTIIGDDTIYINEFVIAKIKGKIKGNKGHPEIVDAIFKNIPVALNYPLIIYKDLRQKRKTKFIFIENSKSHQIVIEIQRVESGKSEINTIIPLGRRTLKQLEAKLQAVFRRIR